MRIGWGMLVFLLTACHVDPVVPPLSGDEILIKAYDADYHYPPGFEYEGGLDGSIYYENSISIGIIPDEWVELHTNSIAQARSWSELSNQRSSQQRDLVSERETDKFFEFKRVSPTNPRDVLLSRVHKTSYFKPWYDRLDPDSIAGNLTSEPITAAHVKTFIEYLWSTGFFGYPDKVLSTTIIDVNSKFKYTLSSVRVIYGDFGLCDVVEVWDYVFQVDKQSGSTTFSFAKVKEIKGTCH